MMRTLTITVAIALGGAGLAGANGRPAGVQSITFRRGAPQHAIAGTTFGALVTADGGVSWRWMCEAAIHSGGTYDPDYAYAASGAIFATTFDGVLANRDGCTFEGTPLGMSFASQVELGGSQDVVHVAVSDPIDTSIYTSADDGVTFPTMATPGLASDWWQTLVVAPSDAQRLYVSGYRIVDGARVNLVLTSDNGGASFTAGGTTGMTLSASSTISIVGVAPTTPTTVYSIVRLEDASNDGFYVSTNAGTSWTRLVGGPQPLVALVRANGHLVVAGPALARVSTDGGALWTDLVSAPPIGCLVERADGVVWACSKDFAPGAARIVATTDLATWTSVLRFGDLAGPVVCPAGTLQHDTCEPSWCLLRMQLGISADPTGCEAPPDGAVDGPPDAAPPPDAPTTMRPRADGCCDSGGAPGTLLVAVVVLAISARSGGSPYSRRRRRTRCRARGQTASAP